MYALKLKLAMNKYAPARAAGAGLREGALADAAHGGRVLCAIM